MWVAAALSAQPEVDDFDGLFAVIVGREREKESGFFLWLPMRKLALFRATLHFLPSSLLAHFLPSLHVSRDFSFI